MSWRDTERSLIVSSRFLTVIAVIGSFAGAVLMFVLGIVNVVIAFRHSLDSEAESRIGTAAIIGVIESLDRFLIALVLLYFAYGVYMLFIHPEEPEEALALPAWLRVTQIGQLKQVVAELIVAVLFVLTLRESLQAFSGPQIEMTWSQIGTLAILPVITLLLALALRLAQFHPKPPSHGSRTDDPPDEARG